MGVNLKLSADRILYWAPRFFAVSFAFFISLFAWDAIIGYDQAEIAAWTVLFRLLPGMAIGAGLLVAWKNEEIGALIFVGMSFLFVVMTNVTMQLVFSFSMLLTGIMFLIHFAIRHNKRRFRSRRM